MKIAPHQSWPHPVLCHLNDDIARTVPEDGLEAPFPFTFTLVPSAEYQSWRLAFEIKLDDEHLASLLRSQQAMLVAKIACSKTYYRSAFERYSFSFHVDVPGDMLFGTVEVAVFLVASKDIENYQHPQQHEDYGGMSFSLSPSEPLAIAPPCTFEAFLEADPILKLASVINIKKGAVDTRHMEVKYDGHRIRVELPPEQFDSYLGLRTNALARGILSSSVILPALLGAFQYLRSLDPGELESFKDDHMWCRCILRRLELLKINIFDSADGAVSLEAAQSLLRNPLKRELDEVKQLITQLVQ